MLYTLSRSAQGLSPLYHAIMQAVTRPVTPTKTLNNKATRPSIECAFIFCYQCTWAYTCKQVATVAVTTSTPIKLCKLCIKRQ